MNITDSLVAEFRRLAKEYDRTSDIEKRRELGMKIDAIGESLSEGQLRQFLKVVGRF